jgi:signal transduction histidine kinase
MSARGGSAAWVSARGRRLAWIWGSTVLASASLVLLLMVVERRQAVEDFVEHAHAVGRAVQGAMQEQEQLLQALQGFYAASREVDREEFGMFLSQGLRRPEHVLAAEWVRRVPEEERAAFEATASAALGRPGFRLTEPNDRGELVPAGLRSEYFPVWYLEPPDRYGPVLGVDVGFEPARRRALETARDTGRSIATEPIELLPQAGPERAGYLFVAPIYRNGVLHETLAQRREHLTGFVQVVVSVSALLSESLRGVAGAAYVQPALHSGTGALAASPARGRPASREGWLRRVTGLSPAASQESWTLGGQDWTLVCEPTAAFHAQPRRREPRMMLILALALVWLSAALALRTLQQGRLVEAQVRERTATLQREVAERERAEQAERRSRTELHEQALVLEGRNLALRRQEAVMQSLLEDMQNANERLADRERSLQDANRRLQELALLKDEFVAKVSHELRTPLTSIKEGLNLLLDNALGDTNAEQRDFLTTMDQDIDRLTELINNMLDIAKIEAGRMRLARRRLTLGQVVSTVVPSIQRIAGRRTITVEGAADLETYGDRNRLIQVLSNLLSNAVKFTPEEGRITVRSWRRDGEVGLDVEDTGAGIAPADLGRLFQKFSQVGPQDPARPRGTGLGLVVCKELVELHGGTIEVRSDVGRGTTFTVRLAAYSDEQALAATFRDLQTLAQSEGRGVALIALNAKSVVADREGRERLADEVRRNVHRGDIVLTLDPAWIVVLAVTEVEGIAAIARRLDAALGQPGLRWGGAYAPRDGVTAAGLFARATRELGDSEQLAAAADGGAASPAERPS